MASFTTSITSLDSFNLVTFVDVRESYCHLNDLDCSFCINESATPDINDVIGIFKVGWKSATDHVCTVPVALPADFEPGSRVECTVKFEATKLPQDDTEFYQFCYVSNAEQRIRGVSSPFQFVSDRLATGWEIVDGENINSLLQVTELSPTDASIVTIEEPLGNEVQQKTSDAVEESKSVEMLTNQVDELKQQLENTQKELQAVREAKELLQVESASSASVMEVALEDIKNRFNDVTATLEELKLSLLEKEAEVSAKEDSIKKLELQLTEAMAEREKRESEFSMLTNDLQTNESKFKEIEADSATQIEKLKLTLQQKEDEWKAKEGALQTQVQDLMNQLDAEKVKINDLEQQLKTATEQHAAHLTDNLETNVTNAADSAAVEEQFHDAVDTSRQCPICDMIFPVDEPIQLLSDHVLAHIERLCPVCEQRFAPDTSEHDLVRHVEKCLTRRPREQVAA